MTRDRSLILELSVVAVFHTALVFSVFLLFSGHNAPGGGFVGGLVAGAAIVLRYVTGGADAVRDTIRPAPQTLLGLGLAIAVVTGTVPWLFGEELLEAASFTAQVPVLGKVKTTSALPFDIGVYLVVVGLVVGMLRTLGGEE